MPRVYDVKLPEGHRRIWEAVTINIGLPQLAAPTACLGWCCHICKPFCLILQAMHMHLLPHVYAILPHIAGGYHRVLVWTGVAPLLLLALIALASALFVLGGHVTRRAAGPLPVKRALLAGLPAELLLLYCFIPAVSNTIFLGFNCRSYQYDSAAGTERSFLIEDLAVQCGSSEHDAIRRSAFILALAWPVCGILTCAALLFACRKAITERTPTALSRATSFLFREFEPDYYAFEGVHTASNHTPAH